MRVSFSGIYDIRFPYGTTDVEIKKKYNDIKNYTEKNFPIQNTDFFNITIQDKFVMQKSEEKLADKGIRIITPIDNTYVISDILEHIDPNILQQYINQTKTELVINKPA